MELSQLEAFDRVARLGSFTSAAEELNLTQPSVSARIANLEAEVGGELFERRGRTLKLTPLGRQFLPYVERTLAVLTDGVEAVENFHAGKSGRIVLGSLDNMATIMLPEPLEQFREIYPSVDITIVVRRFQDILDGLYDGSGTLGLIGAPLFDKGIKILAHFQEPIYGVVGLEHPLAALHEKQGHVTLSDVTEHTVFRVTLGPRATAFVQGAVEAARGSSGGAVVHVPWMMVIRMIILGQGVAFLPRSIVQRHVERRKMMFLNITDMPQLSNEPMLVALRGRALDRPNQEFVRMVKNHWRDMLVYEDNEI